MNIIYEQLIMSRRAPQPSRIRMYQLCGEMWSYLEVMVPHAPFQVMTISAATANLGHHDWETCIHTRGWLVLGISLPLLVISHPWTHFKWTNPQYLIVLDAEISSVGWYQSMYIPLTHPMSSRNPFPQLLNTPWNPKSCKASRGRERI